MTRIILAALVGVLVSGPAWGADEKGFYEPYGWSERKCAEFLNDYAKSKLKKKEPTKGGWMAFTYNTDFSEWVGFISGRLTGTNALQLGKRNFFVGVHIVDVAAWLGSWCRDNMDANMATALDAYIATRTK